MHAEAKSRFQLLREPKEEKPKPSKKDNRLPFEWRHECQHVFYFVMYLINWNGVWRLVAEARIQSLGGRVSILQILAAIITVGYPAVFLQNFIGQYTRKSCLSIGDMLPILYGCGFLMLFIACARVVIQMRYTAVMLYYLLVTLFNQDLPWMNCFPHFFEFSPTCIPQRTIELCPTLLHSKTPCFDGLHLNTSGPLFRDLFALRRLEPRVQDQLWLPNKFLFFIVHGSIIYVSFLLVGTKKIQTIDVPIKLVMIIYFGTLCTNLIVACTQRGSFYGLGIMYDRMRLSTLTNLDLWLAAFRKVILGMKLSEGGHFLFAAFIPLKTPAPHRALHLLFVYTLIAFFGVIYHNLFAGILYFQTGLKVTDLRWLTSEDIMFVMFPVALGLQASAYFFCLLYFFVHFITSFYAMILKLIVIEMSITEHFNIIEFFAYVRVGVATFVFICSLCLQFTKSEFAVTIIRHELRVFSMLALTMQVCVMQLYGMQRFCDDVHFFYGFPVSKFLKLSWILIPIISMMVFSLEFEYNFTHEYLNLERALRVFLISPLIFCFIYKIFGYARKKNLMGAIRPTDEFGPPDLELKTLRVLYNPRHAVKYRRQKEICNHICLNQGEAAKIALLDEIELIKKFIQESSAFTSEQNLGPKIQQELERHKSLLIRQYNRMVKYAPISSFGLQGPIKD